MREGQKRRERKAIQREIERVEYRRKERKN